MKEIIWLPQNEKKDSRYAKAHKELREKYGIKWSWGISNGKYIGDVKLNTGKQITKGELTLFINKLLPNIK